MGVPSSSVRIVYGKLTSVAVNVSQYILRHGAVALCRFSLWRSDMQCRISNRYLATWNATTENLYYDGCSEVSDLQYNIRIESREKSMQFEFHDGHWNPNEKAEMRRQTVDRVRQYASHLSEYRRQNYNETEQETGLFLSSRYGNFVLSRNKEAFCGYNYGKCSCFPIAEVWMERQLENICSNQLQ